MSKDTLDLNFPTDIGILYKAVIVRHDLVHRNGKKKDGGEHDISVEIITEIIKEMKEFIYDIDNQWTEN